MKHLKLDCQHTKPFWPRVEISWWDAKVSDEVGNLDFHENKLVLHHTIGYLLKKNKISVMIGQSYSHSTNVELTICIPTRCIAKMIYLKEKKCAT